MTTTEARKEVKRLHNIMKVNGWKSEAGRAAMMEESKLYREFKEEHGEAALIEMKVGKASGFGKSHNSKGNGYGNL